MNGVMKKISRKKVAVASMIVVIVVFSVAYAIVQTRTAFAILTTPPPGIPGPYYVTAEAKIYGPVVDLAAIKSKMGGTYASDYTYVQWGTNPFYRVYVDNTFQEVYYGQMKDIMERFSWGHIWEEEGFAIERDLKSTFSDMKNVGAVDPLSELGALNYFGNLPGIFVALSHRLGEYTPAGNFTTFSSQWYAVYARVRGPTGYSWVKVTLNGSDCVAHPGQNFNSTGGSGVSFVWVVNGYDVYGVTVFLRDLSLLETTISRNNLRVYEVWDSPGTGFVSKYVSPSSSVAGSTINVIVRLDPPSAGNVNITDFYPNTFTWTSVDVLLEKFKVGVGFEESAYVNVVPAPDGSNMKFTIYYNQAPSILQSLLSDEYIYLTYSLRVPDVAGEYTLPAASMSYLIPTPQP
jgi:hypothetical protein